MGSDDSSPQPTPKMTGVKTALSFGFAVIFDFLKLLFTFLIFTGPYIAGKAAEMYASSQGLPEWLSGFAFYAVGGSTAAAEILVPQIALAIGAFGAIMAIVIGFMGGLFMFLWFLLVCRIPPWRKGGSTLLWMSIGWIMSLIPFVNMFFPQTIATWGIVSAQRKADEKELAEWREAQKKREYERKQQVEMQIQQQQLAQAESIAEEEQAGEELAEEQEAAEEAQASSEQEEAEAPTEEDQQQYETDEAQVIPMQVEAVAQATGRQAYRQPAPTSRFEPPKKEDRETLVQLPSYTPARASQNTEARQAPQSPSHEMEKDPEYLKLREHTDAEARKLFVKKLPTTATPSYRATRDLVDKAHREADPTTYSPLPLEKTTAQGEVGSTKNNIEVESGGDRYITIDKKPELQQVVARMLKGVVNVADVVRGAGPASPEFYSKVMPLDRVQGATSEDEMRADLFILKQVFGDYDHYLRDGEFHQNIARQNDRSVYYDFDKAGPMDAETSSAFASLNKESDRLPPAATERTIEKLDQLQKRFSGEDGKRMLESIIKSSGKTPHELFALYDFELANIKEKTGSKEFDTGSVQSYLLSRIRTVRDSIVPPIPKTEGKPPDTQQAIGGRV